MKQLLRVQLIIANQRMTSQQQQQQNKKKTAVKKVLFEFQK